MAVKKSNSYISAELDWAEAQLSTWKQFIDANPFHLVEDRKEMMKTKNGGAYYAVVQTIEAIHKSLRDTMKEYLALLAIVDGLREKEEAKAVAKGNSNIPDRMQSKDGN